MKPLILNKFPHFFVYIPQKTHPCLDDDLMSNNYEKNISGCAILGILDESGERFSGETIIKGIANMHDRSNGLGGGFACYGCYPDYKDFYALHIMYQENSVAERVEAYLNENFIIELQEIIPHNHIPAMAKHPLIRRYFVKPKKMKEDEPGKIFEDISEDEYVVRATFKINSDFPGAFVFSSGKDMGIFKGVGYPEEVADFYRLTDYEGYCWTAHGRFPTNSQAWWGGAHPFGLLDISVIHNGEISSYGINKRYLENFGYKCTLFTDTEVIAYLWDLFLRKHQLDLQTGAKILAAPFWSQIDRMDEEMKKILHATPDDLCECPINRTICDCCGLYGRNDRIK